MSDQRFNFNQLIVAGTVGLMAGFIVCLLLSIAVEVSRATDLCGAGYIGGDFRLDERNQWRLVCEREEWK